MSALIAVLALAATPHATATAGVRVVRGERIDVEQMEKRTAKEDKRVTVRRDDQGTTWIEFS